MKNLIEALKRFDSLEIIIAELECYDREDTLEDLIDYLDDEADYASE